jgi:hypothetical protein
MFKPAFYFFSKHCEGVGCVLEFITVDLSKEPVRFVNRKLLTTHYCFIYYAIFAKIGHVQSLLIIHNSQTRLSNVFNRVLEAFLHGFSVFKVHKALSFPIFFGMRRFELNGSARCVIDVNPSVSFAFIRTKK